MSNATLHNYDIFAQGLPYNDLLKTLTEETQVTHFDLDHLWDRPGQNIIIFANRYRRKDRNPGSNSSGECMRVQVQIKIIAIWERAKDRPAKSGGRGIFPPRLQIPCWRLKYQLYRGDFPQNGSSIAAFKPADLITHS